jgi:hypothetical protein
MQAMEPKSIKCNGDEFVVICENADGKHEYQFKFEPVMDFVLLNLDPKFLKDNYQDPGTYMMQHAVGCLNNAIEEAKSFQGAAPTPVGITAGGGTKYIVQFDTNNGTEELEFTADGSGTFAQGSDLNLATEQLDKMTENLNLAIRHFHDARNV